MAIFHLHSEIIGRSEGKSAVAAAAYRAGVKLYSQHQDIEFDYSKRRGVAYSEILKPTHAPDWTSDRDALWNAVELFEKRKDSTYARDIVVALPVELPLEQQKHLLREYLNDQFVALGMIADYAIHDAESHNPHAHIMLTMRPVLENSFGKKAREWNDKTLFEKWREAWAVTTNKYLALNGLDIRISHLSYAAQGIDLEPTTHRGFMSRHNVETLDRYKRAKEIKERNYSRLLAKPSIALDVLTHHESVFSHHDLARFVNERSNGIEEFTALKNAIETCDQMVKLGQGLDGKDYYTSTTVLAQERDLIHLATSFSKQKTHALDPQQLNFVLASRSLTEEQEAAFRHILSGSDLSLVVGFAGTGKSYLMDAIREAYEACGYKVVGTALAGKAADGLKESANIESHTIARFLLDWQNGRQQLTDKTVLVIDEVGMVGTRQFLALLKEADRVGAKVVCCGDPEQIPPVEAGCPFRFLLERIPHVSLTNVVRQKEVWQRQATIELSTRQHAKAIDRYHDHGYVCGHETKEIAVKQIVSRWGVYIADNPGKTAVMMSYRNVDVLTMNLLAREQLIAAGRLRGSSTEVQTSAYGKLNFSKGERVMFLRNEKSLQVKNGYLGTIEHIKGQTITVALDNGGKVAFDVRDYNDLGYGYAATVHKMQGVTVDRSFVLATKQFDRFITNVALDRHRDNMELHYGKDEFASYDNLKRNLSRGESKVLAVEFAQARGIDYDVHLDQAAVIQSQKDFRRYHQDILKESLPIIGTPAEAYLLKLGITHVETQNVRFHPAVWDHETQCTMPALIAKAIGQGSDGIEVKGVQVTFLDNAGNKAAIESPVRYSGSPDAIIMLQKPVDKDDRWYVAPDIETGLAVCSADRSLRVACLATQEAFKSNPLEGKGDKRLIFCANHETPTHVVSTALDVFSTKGFDVSVAKPEVRESFVDMLKADGARAVSAYLGAASREIAAKAIAARAIDIDLEHDIDR